MIDKWISKINQWFGEPLGNVGIWQDTTETELKKPNESFENPKPQPTRMRGRGDKRETTRHIEEFYPRGSAGRREPRGPSGRQKAVMPHQGNRSQYPDR
jgi:hypothetical protein